MTILRSGSSYRNFGNNSESGAPEVFGERNRGNVYNLLRQISGGKFLIVGRGENKKAMACVGNIVVFIRFSDRE